MSNKDRNSDVGSVEVDPSIEGVERDEKHPGEILTDLSSTLEPEEPAAQGAETAETDVDPDEDMAEKPFLSGPAKVIGGAVLALLVSTLVIGYLVIRSNPDKVGQFNISPVPTGIPAGNPGAPSPLGPNIEVNLGKHPNGDLTRCRPDQIVVDKENHKLVCP